MTKQQKIHLANQAFESSINAFAEAMQTACVIHITQTGKMTWRMETAWNEYIRACKRIMELGD